MSAVLLFLAWSVVVVSEFLRFGAPAALTLSLGVAFAIVFAGYVVGWRYELVGGIVTLVGVAALFATSIYVFQDLPQLAVIWFAAPGALYLLAWTYDKRHASTPVR
jgi:hypothetical protein